MNQLAFLIHLEQVKTMKMLQVSGEKHQAVKWNFEVSILYYAFELNQS